MKRKYHYNISVEYVSDIDDRLGGNFCLIVSDRHNRIIYKKNILPFEIDDDVISDKHLTELTKEIYTKIYRDIEIEELSDKVAAIKLPSIEREAIMTDLPMSDNEY
jgi:hypothetical protein